MSLCDPLPSIGATNGPRIGTNAIGLFFTGGASPGAVAMGRLSVRRA